MNRKIFKYFVGILIFIVMLFSFWKNFLGTVDENYFEKFGKHSDRIPVIDLIHTDIVGKTTMFFPTYTLQNGENEKNFFEFADIFINQKYNEINISGLKDYYYSHVGLDSVINTMFFRIFGNKYTIQAVQFFTALMTTVMLMIIILWIKKRTNYFAVLSLILFILFFSPDIIKYGQSFYWKLWSWLFPMSIMMAFTDSSLYCSKHKYILSFLIALFTCFVRFAFNFEFVSVVMIAMICPYAYLYFQNFKSYRKNKKIISALFKVFIPPSLGAVLAFLATTMLKLYNTFLIVGNWSEAIKIYNVSLEHTGLNADGRIGTIIKYLGTTWFSYININISYGNLIIACIIILFIVLCLIKIRKESFKNYIPFSLMTWFSFLAPISWMVLANVHCTYSVHGEYIITLWYIPFLLFLIPNTTYVLSDFIYCAVKRNNERIKSME